MLSRAKDARPPCDYSNLEFWQDLPYIYTPLITLRKLIAKGKAVYQKGILVESWSEQAERVMMVFKQTTTSPLVLKARD